MMATIYKPLEAIQLLRPTLRNARISTVRVSRAGFSTSRVACATQSSTTNSDAKPSQPPRRHVTVTNDTGAVRWSDLSVGEKAARTTQQSFNFVVIIAGVVLTGAIGYLLFSDIFSPNSKTSHFNRAVTKIRASRECQALLGPGSQIEAHGEPSFSRWARNRFIASTSETDQWGTEHMRFKFYLTGPKNEGVVHVHLARKPSEDEWVYRTLAVDVKGEKRVWLEGGEGEDGGRKGPKIFGARWW
ncbi:mitochondrial import inner membrane translocase subunit Tim21 [Sporormia fimetaria CBS 119925]|uniref:Mitochondrial import inner membrane translocase subunit Tim21 n=1 Tax=Sporormia fimetaria CBS 119925 TaxID=1340428 RepID=A0A6A6VEU1_9PLEO|nr:mitochondrial import inner membrane translocase subunit Tim21 [Sporormia fimetaria CBS 119925]